MSFVFRSAPSPNLNYDCHSKQRPLSPVERQTAAYPDSAKLDCPEHMIRTGEGQVAVFVAVGHHSAECVGIHATRRATRFEALEPIRHGVRRSFGTFAKDTACSLAVRHDHGSQYMSDAFHSELTFLGIESSPAFVRAPEGNGCAERFIRTLKENLLWVRTFDTVEALRQALLAFRDTYNASWLLSDMASDHLPSSEPSSFRSRPWPRRLPFGVSSTTGGTVHSYNVNQSKISRLEA